MKLKTNLIFILYITIKTTFNITKANPLEPIATHFQCKNIHQLIFLTKATLNLSQHFDYFFEKQTSVLLLSNLSRINDVLNRNINAKIGVVLSDSTSDDLQIIEALADRRLFWFVDDAAKFKIVLEKIKLLTLNVNIDLVILSDTTRSSNRTNFDENNCTKTDMSLHLLQARFADNNQLEFTSLTINKNATSCALGNRRHREQAHNRILKIGKRNSSRLESSGTLLEDDEEEESKLMEILDCFRLFLKTKIEVNHYQKSGSTNGEWTGLLDSFVNGELDLALEMVINTPEHLVDMIFTHKIFKSMYSVYLKPEKSNQFRDIYLIPFNSTLILSVFGIGLICSVFMASINWIFKNDESTSDVIIWFVAILSMQGNVAKPKCASGNLILLVALLFALIIFNSYSAFITSILSVRLNNIKSIGDLLASDYQVGYVKNSADEAFLRNMNESELQQIYLRGYLQNDLANVTQGLLKIAKGNFGFFTTIYAGRKSLQNINNYRCFQDIIEIPIPSTKNSIAFPMAKQSPYRKLINLSIIRMYETGLHKYIYTSFLPKMIKCKKETVFQSAHLADLITAFGILASGIVASVILLGIEHLWNYKIKKQIN